MNILTEYLEQFALLSLEKQEKLAILIGEHSAELNLEEGMIQFNEGVLFPFQVLGTESDNSLTWLWGWAEEQPEIPLNRLSSAYLMKDWGEKAGIPEFTKPSVDLTRSDGRAISLISSEICGASCSYQDSYEGGAVYLLLFGEAIDQQPSFDVAGLSRQFSEVLSLYDLNERTALLSYLRKKGLPFSEDNQTLSAELETGEKLTAIFDEKGRLLTIYEV